MSLEEMRQKYEIEAKKIMREFFTHGQESVTCDECGSKGTGFTFKEIYQSYLENLDPPN